MEKKEELLERLVNEFAAYNRLTAVRIAKENLDCWGKTDEDFPLDPPRIKTVKITSCSKNLVE